MIMFSNSIKTQPASVELWGWRDGTVLLIALKTTNKRLVYFMKPITRAGSSHVCGLGKITASQQEHHNSVIRRTLKVMFTHGDQNSCDLSLDLTSVSSSPEISPPNTSRDKSVYLVIFYEFTNHIFCP